MFNFEKNRKLRKERKRLREHVAFTLHADDDILSEQQIKALKALAEELDAVSGAEAGTIKKCIASGNERMLKIIPRKKFSTIREYADILAVAMAVAFGIRGLFLQPFKNSHKQYAADFIRDSLYCGGRQSQSFSGKDTVA